MARLPVHFLTDFGDADEYAGACRAVIERLAPGTSVVDLAHGIEPGDVRRGALALAAVARRAGPAVYLAVVDPGVGTARRALALRAGRSYLVGPDNGLLTPAANQLGGAGAVLDVSRSPLRLEPVAPTFHGRDLFAPVAAHLAAGFPFDGLGEPVDPATLLAPPLPTPTLGADRVVAHVLFADRFGNLVLDVRPGELPAPLAAQAFVEAPGAEAQAVRGVTFADGAPGEFVLLDDSSGYLALALNGESAADRLGADRDTELVLRAR